MTSHARDAPKPARAPKVPPKTKQAKIAAKKVVHAAVKSNRMILSCFRQ
jgi:hypothetical protein